MAWTDLMDKIKYVLRKSNIDIDKINNERKIDNCPDLLRIENNCYYPASQVVEEDYHIRDDEYFYFFVESENLCVNYNEDYDLYFFLCEKRVNLFNPIIIKIKIEYVLKIEIDYSYTTDPLLVYIIDNYVEKVRDIHSISNNIPDTVKLWRGLI